MTSKPRILLVFAHRDEASAFADVPHLITGVGKINAASELGAALAEAGAGAVSQANGAGADDASRSTAIDRVIVLGTAGVIGDGVDRLDLDTVYQITAAVQHDFSLPSPELSPAGQVLLETAHTATIATGDVFVQDDEQRERIASLGAKLVDMETYAFAAVCARWQVPLQVFKVPSDFADSSTTDEEWDTIVFRKSEQLREFWNARLA